jgi:hypothetical protein
MDGLDIDVDDPRYGLALEPKLHTELHHGKWWEIGTGNRYNEEWKKFGKFLETAPGDSTAKKIMVESFLATIESKAEYKDIIAKGKHLIGEAGQGFNYLIYSGEKSNSNFGRRWNSTRRETFWRSFHQRNGKSTAGVIRYGVGLGKGWASKGGETLKSSWLRRNLHHSRKCSFGRIWSGSCGGFPWIHSWSGRV